MTISAYIQEMKLEDRRQVLNQLLSIRYGDLDAALSSVIELLAQIPSNAMLRLLLTCSRPELLEALEQPLEQVSSIGQPTDLFRVMGVFDEYCLKKEVERSALQTLAKLRFGEINTDIESSISVLLQSPIESSMRKMYCLSREELIREARRF